MKKAFALLALALAAVALVACGGDDDGTTTTTTNETTQEATGGGAGGGGAEGAGGEAGASTVKLEADPNGALAYTTEEVSAKAGDITIEFTNPQPLQHDVAVEDASGGEVGKTEIISDSSTSTTLKDVKAGKYPFYCTVPGHREAGMEGTLTVE